MDQLPIPWGKASLLSTPSRQTSPSRSAGTSTGGFSLEDLIASHTHAPPFDAPRTHSSASASTSTSSPSRAATPPANSPPARSPPTPSPKMSPHPRSPLLRSHTEPLVQLAPPPHQGIKRSTTHASDLTGAGPGGRRGSERNFIDRERGRGGAGKVSSKDSDRLVLEKYALYETKTKFYIVGWNQADTRYRVLKLDRTVVAQDDPGQDHAGLGLTEDSAVYSSEELKDLLEALGAGNMGGIQMVVKEFYGIAGFVRFTGTYYMILIMTRAPVALIGGHYVYHCETTSLRAVSQSVGARSAEEARLLAAFQGVDLSKNFYFSNSYDLTHTLQHNLTCLDQPSATSEGGGALAAFNDKWVWNHNLLQAFRHFKSKSPWVLPLIHGFLSVFGRTVYITLIARRSRHFAGARFLKRGVNGQGYVANDVESEQIVSEALTTPFYTISTSGHRQPNPRYTSFVQVRGSIPLYWSQESINMSPKPPIELTVVDPYFSAAALHFDDLLGRYGGPITVLNLIKQNERQPRESKLLGEFKQCIDYLNLFLPPEQRIRYNAWDLSAANKQRDKDVIGILEDIAEEALESTNFFHTGPEPSWYALNRDADTPPFRSTPLLQYGVIRTNCIDCLDRTNAAQFVVAKAALGHQLHALGIIHHPRLPFDSDAVNLITQMFHDHGDTVALQYGGSALVNTMETYRKVGQWTSHSRDMIENLKRYYANSFVDADKQAAIDLFLGIDTAPPLPKARSRAPPRRSYRDWFTPTHLEQSLGPDGALEKIAQAVDLDDNYWQTYYRPMMWSDFTHVFAFTVNSTSNYDSSMSLTGAHAKPRDMSPFTPRLSHSASITKINVGSGVRRWMSHRGRREQALRTRIHSQRIDEGPPVAPAPANTTEAIVGRLLNPIVADDEAKEYASYMDQFAHLSLSQDLSEKDALLYRSSAAIAAGGSEGVHLQVDRASHAVYVDSVKVSRPGQELRGSEVGHGVKVVGLWELPPLEER